MKRTKISIWFLLPILLASLKLNAQNYEWSVDLGEIASCKQLTVNHNQPYFYSFIEAENNQDKTVIKTDADGNIVDEFKIPSFYSQRLNIDNEGNYIITGSFSDTVDVDPGDNVYNLISVGGNDLTIVKYSPAGALLWAKNIGISSNGSNVHHYCTKTDNNNNIYITGDWKGTMDFDPGPGTEEYSVDETYSFVYVIDASGNFKTVKLWNGVCQLNIDIDDAGNLYCAGGYYRTMDIDPGEGEMMIHTSSNSTNTFFLKLNSAGEFQWGKTLNNNSFVSVFQLKTDAFDNLYIWGNFGDTTDFNPGEGEYIIDELSDFYSTPFVLKVDNNGEFLWARSFPAIDTQNKFLCNVSDNGFYITSNLYFTVNIKEGPLTYRLIPQGPGDFFILKLDSEGNIQTVHQLGGSGLERVNNIVIDNDQNIYALGLFRGSACFDPAGGSCLTNSSQFIDNGFILKLSQTTTSFKQISENNTISVYPNPAINTLYVENITANAVIEIFNVQGNLVKQLSLVSDQKNIDISSLKQGMYIIKIRDNDKSLTQSFIKN